MTVIIILLFSLRILLFMLLLLALLRVVSKPLPVMENYQKM